jgi:alanine dehydrogenase
MSDEARWISEEQVVSLLDVRTAMHALREALSLEADGSAANMTKAHLLWREGYDLHAVGGWLGEFVGTKTWARTKMGAAPLLLLFDANNGALRAIIEAVALGQLRTAAVSGVATAALAQPDASVLAIAGTGLQALPQVAAIAAVRKLQQIRVFGRDAGRRQAFVHKVTAALAIPTAGFPDMAQAAEGASLITLVTTARDVILTSGMVAPGAHVNAVGAIAPDRIEFEPRLLSRCQVIAVDNVASARELSSELRTYFGEGSWSAVKSLSTVLQTAQQRSASSDITLFKSMGMGLSDLALGVRALKRAEAVGIGRSIPGTKRAVLSFSL